MGFALRITKAIDALSRLAGVVAVWLVLLSALLSALNAVLRYSVGFLLSLERSTGWGVFGGLVALYTSYSNVMNEAVWFMFAGMVMLGGAWTLKMNEHVRVDLFYGAVSERTRSWIDLLGGLFFLLPLCLLLIHFTWGWAWSSLAAGEASANAGGLPPWPAKMALPIGFGLLALQGVSEIIKCILALTSGYVREFAYEKPVQ
ncbi:MAG: TRAP transporter small permease subunit [Devosia sp.]